MMIEADVRYGVVIGTVNVVPIMSHTDPFSDLSLNEFVDRVIQVRFQLV